MSQKLQKNRNIISSESSLIYIVFNQFPAKYIVISDDANTLAMQLVRTINQSFIIIKWLYFENAIKYIWLRTNSLPINIQNKSRSNLFNGFSVVIGLDLRATMKLFLLNLVLFIGTGFGWLKQLKVNSM